MSEPLFYLDDQTGLNLQGQIRKKLVENILGKIFPVGQRLPSSRKLSEQLGVSRNTVVLAYQHLIDEGYLISRERSGIYVNDSIFNSFVERAQDLSGVHQKTAAWRQRFKKRVPKEEKPSFAALNPGVLYSFMDDQYDASLFPVNEWREASRLALGVREIRQWSGGHGDSDDPMLVEEIRTKILPRRGINARPEEILITVGTQNALYLLSELLIDRQSVIAVEEPGYPDLRDLLSSKKSGVIHQPLDKDGMIVDSALNGCDIVVVTPSHQVPTAVTMSMQRRLLLLEKANQEDFLIIEDDFECESNYLGQPHPALKSLDDAQRVIYVSSLSKVLAPGIRLGFMVAPVEVINETRNLRRLILRFPALNNQRAAAFFLSLGHYDAALLRLGHIFKARWTALRDALNHYFPNSIHTSPASGGTTYWINGPEELDVTYLTGEAARHGILIEPVGNYYATRNHPRNCFRLTVTGLPENKIRPAVKSLAELVRKLTRRHLEILDKGKTNWVSGKELKQTLSGATLISKTVYGDPLTIKLFGDGNMSGIAGFAKEDCDTGKWWIEGDRWHRQWNRWSYGEAIRFYVVIDADRIKWFNDALRLIDTARIQRFG